MTRLSGGGQAVAGAYQGGMIGAPFGPVGMLIGGGLGGLVGAARGSAVRSRQHEHKRNIKKNLLMYYALQAQKKKLSAAQMIQEGLKQGGYGYDPATMEQARGAVGGQFENILSERNRLVDIMAAQRGSYQGGARLADISRNVQNVGTQKASALAQLAMMQAQRKASSLDMLLGLQTDLDWKNASAIMQYLQQKKQQRAEEQQALMQGIGNFARGAGEIIGGAL